MTLLPRNRPCSYLEAALARARKHLEDEGYYEKADERLLLAKGREAKRWLEREGKAR